MSVGCRMLYRKKMEISNKSSIKMKIRNNKIKMYKNKISNNYSRKKINSRNKMKSKIKIRDKKIMIKTKMSLMSHVNKLARIYYQMMRTISLNLIQKKTLTSKKVYKLKMEKSNSNYPKPSSLNNKFNSSKKFMLNLLLMIDNK